MMPKDSNLFEEPCQPLSSTLNAWQPLLPWLAGSGIAMGQALLATQCTVTTLGKCVGCGSCIVAVASLGTWAMQRRKADGLRKAEAGLEPFEVRTSDLNSDR